MKVVFHPDFYQVYTSDPAAEAGRMEAVMEVIGDAAEIITAQPAEDESLALAHSAGHISHIKGIGLYGIASLAAGAAIQSARIGLKEPCFGLLRPPGHHASRDSCWGFCFFNNMAVALLALRAEGLIQTTHVLDFDLHHGDGNVNILSTQDWVSIHNPDSHNREAYLQEVEQKLNERPVDMIGISAGFDNHYEDWGGLLSTDDYRSMGAMVRRAARNNNGGCFAILEGGYNHAVLGRNVEALLQGLEEG